MIKNKYLDYGQRYKSLEEAKAFMGSNAIVTKTGKGSYVIKSPASGSIMIYKENGEIQYYPGIVKNVNEEQEW
jgi:viroplasmin and RNaseH domain-containing protein